MTTALAVSSGPAVGGGGGIRSVRVAVVDAEGRFCGRVPVSLAARLATEKVGIIGVDGCTLHLLCALPTTGDALARSFARGTEDQIRRGLRAFDRARLKWETPRR